MSSGYPGFSGLAPIYPSTPPRRAKWDVVLSVTLMAVNLLSCIAAASGGILILAFTDFCPAQTCDMHAATMSISIALSVAALGLVAGTVLVAMRIIRRKVGWPFAAATLMWSFAADIVGFGAYIASVGY